MIRHPSIRLTAAALLAMASTATTVAGAPTAAPTAAATTAATTAATVPAVTPAAAAACGNHLLEAGEKCETCAADCRPAACTPQGRHNATVSVTPQSGYESIGAITVLLSYRSDRLALPGSGSQPEIQARLKGRQAGAQLFINDVDYGVRVVAARGDGLTSGALFSVAFDGCAGAAAPTTADLACRVESCATGGVPLPECGCSVSLD